ncbi:MAG: hypothetical protein JSS72_01945 [Armatimonadetes bacterium]|nr:hypothetical protein [Armatimonadota bacterium]
MIRYQGGLKKGGRIAVVSNDAIGNFVVATPLLQLLRTELEPASITYFGGTRTLELQTASDLFEKQYPLHGSPMREAAKFALQQEFDLVVNNESTPFAMQFAASLCGEGTQVVGPVWDAQKRQEMPYPDDEAGRLAMDPKWIAEDLCQRYPSLKSPFIGEIFCRLAYLKGDVPPYRVPMAMPEIPIPEVLIATSASLPEKLWPLESWMAILKKFQGEGLSVGLLGAPPKAQKEFWKGAGDEDRLVDSGLTQDLRGRLSLPQVVGALAQAKLVLTLDNGILHLACAAQPPTVGLFRYGIHRLWAPPAPSLTVIHAAPDGAVGEIGVESVWSAVQKRIQGNAQAISPQAMDEEQRIKEAHAQRLRWLKKEQDREDIKRQTEGKSLILNLVADEEPE